MKQHTCMFLLALILTFSIQTKAAMSEEVVQIQKQWAQVNYMPDGDAKEKAFEKLSKAATQIRLNHPKDAESWIWEGIIYSSYAGAKGGISALGLAKKAKAAYEEALNIDEAALNGSAHTSIGVLFHKVPGWPLGFGSDKKAVKHLKKGLVMNPDGIDSNFFYAQYLVEEESDYLNAKNYLEKALDASPRPSRPVADLERRKEVKLLLAEVVKELED